jgi:hypothetical protein
MILYDYDWASANDEIGRAELKIADLQPGQKADLWLDVTSEGGPSPCSAACVPVGAGWLPDLGIQAEGRRHACAPSTPHSLRCAA